MGTKSLSPWFVLANEGHHVPAALPWVSIGTASPSILIPSTVLVLIFHQCTSSGFSLTLNYISLIRTCLFSQSLRFTVSDLF